LILGKARVIAQKLGIAVLLPIVKSFLKLLADYKGSGIGSGGDDEPEAT